jgi:hypothetical protein
MASFLSGGTYKQYVPDVMPVRITFLHVSTWPDATAVLTRPAVDGCLVLAESNQSIRIAYYGHYLTHAHKIVLTGTVEALAPIAARIADESRTPATRIAYHRALNETWQDATTQRKFKKNFKLALARA